MDEVEDAEETAAEVAASLDAVRTLVVAIVLKLGTKYVERIAVMIASVTRRTKYFINIYMVRYPYMEMHRIRNYSQSSNIRNWLRNHNYEFSIRFPHRCQKCRLHCSCFLSLVLMSAEGHYNFISPVKKETYA